MIRITEICRSESIVRFRLEGRLADLATQELRVTLEPCLAAGCTVLLDLAGVTFADRAGLVVSLAAETFNDGIRAYYFAFAGVCWFFSPVAMMLGTAGIVTILYQREFRSDVLAVLSR